MELSKEDGALLVEIARNAVRKNLGNNDISLKSTDYPDKFNEPRGVFVTIHTHPDNELRGCIGFTEPVKSLFESLTEAAVLAATNDIRFPPLTKKELSKVTFEITVLSNPEPLKIKPEKYPENIKIGRDGLIIKAVETVHHNRPSSSIWNFSVFKSGVKEWENKEKTREILKSGILLPQVPVEYDWDSTKFLNQVCIKAGLPATYWKTGEARIYKFTGIIFSEKKPNNGVVKKSFSEKAKEKKE
ncbi:MAG: TIGR00296 family protein [Candidatus Undinarchaeales archaeon]